MTEEPPRPAHLPPGYDEENPYADEDLSSYPDWWHENIKEFQRYGMRPYRPPRFTDGELTPDVVDTLETDLGMTIHIQTTAPQTETEWEVVVDGEPVGSVPRRRKDEGYTLYELPSDEFAAMVRTAVENS